MASNLTRRNFLTAAALAGGTAATAARAEGGAPAPRFQGGASPWPLALNTSTIRPASLEDKIRVTAETGWDSIELWINDLEEYEKGGGSLEDLGKRIRDKGLFVCNVIGLWNSMPATAEAFEESLVQTRERLRMMSAVGSRHAAAIPQPDREDFDLVWATEMYKRLFTIGRADYNITVTMEFIGFFKSVYRLGQACMIALDSDLPEACILPDTYHLFRGGSGFNGLRHLQGGLIANFHWNDVPADVPREGSGDADRIYPGDGVLPLEQALRDLKAIGYTRTLSLELFNRAHWEMDPKEVAATGLQKMLANIAAAGV